MYAVPNGTDVPLEQATVDGKSPAGPVGGSRKSSLQVLSTMTENNKFTDEEEDVEATPDGECPEGDHRGDRHVAQTIPSSTWGSRGNPTRCLYLALPAFAVG